MTGKVRRKDRAKGMALHKIDLLYKISFSDASFDPLLFARIMNGIHQAYIEALIVGIVTQTDEVSSYKGIAASAFTTAHNPTSAPAQCRIDRTFWSRLARLIFSQLVRSMSLPFCPGKCDWFAQPLVPIYDKPCNC